MLATAADGASGTMFVGSQNFSAASWGLRDRQPANVELGVVLASHTPAGVEELRARFPIALAPDAAFGTTATERGYVMARGPTDGDHSPTGVQFRWRNRCNDPQSLGAWRLFLHRWWKMCSRCRAPDVPCDLSVAAIEELANAGEAFLCSACARTRKQRLQRLHHDCDRRAFHNYKVCIECGRGEKHVSRRERDAGRGHYTGPYCVLGCTVRYGDTSTRVRWTGSDIYNNSQTCYGHGIFVLRIHSIHISRLDSFSISCPQFISISCNIDMIGLVTRSITQRGRAHRPHRAATTA